MLNCSRVSAVQNAGSPVLNGPKSSRIAPRLAQLQTVLTCSDRCQGVIGRRLEVDTAYLSRTMEAGAYTLTLFSRTTLT